MRTPLILVHSLLLLSLALLLLPAAAADSPWLISELDAKVSFYSEIEVRAPPGSQLEWVEGLFYNVPQEGTMQRATLLSASPKIYSVQTDSFGNGYAKFRWYQPSGNLSYAMDWDLLVDRFGYAITSPGMMGEPAPEDLAHFLEPDNLTAWTPYMKAKAESLVDGSDNRLDAARRLSWWVSSSVGYDYACWNLSMPAKEVFEKRLGVCDEFSNLFISMCRSVGIPARYVEGIVYNGDTWNFHAWAEVYIDGWLPVDPTYDEVGFVDSSHIELAKVYGDSDVYQRIKWEGHGVSVAFGRDELSVEVRKMTQRPMLALSAEVKPLVAGGEIMEATLTVSNLADSYMPASCSVKMPPSMLLLDWEKKPLLLRPYGEATLKWRIASPSDLDKQLIHTMPLRFICFPGSDVNATVSIDPRAQKGEAFAALADDITVVSGDLALVTVRNCGTGDLNNLVVSLCADGVCAEAPAPGMAPGVAYDIPFAGMGLQPGQKLTASLSSPEFSAEPYEVSSQRLEFSGQQGRKYWVPEQPKPEDVAYGSLALFLAMMLFVCSVAISAAYVFKFR